MLRPEELMMLARVLRSIFLFGVALLHASLPPPLPSRRGPSLLPHLQVAAHALGLPEGRYALPLPRLAPRLRGGGGRVLPPAAGERAPPAPVNSLAQSTCRVWPNCFCISTGIHPRTSSACAQQPGP